MPVVPRLSASTAAPPERRLLRPIGAGAAAGEMAVLELGDPDRPVDLVFAHANGFNALTYRSLLAPLAQAGRRIWAPDLRGHGLSRLPADPVGRRGWNDHARDLADLLAGLDGPPVVVAGHSMGGTSGLLAAALDPSRVAGLVLLDPVIWRRAAVLAFQLPFMDRLPERIPLVKNARKRRARFDSREQALQVYRGRGAFKGWPDAMLADYLADGLVEDGEGFTLACTPDWEASNYAAQAHDPWKALATVGRPVRILKAAVASTCHVSTAPRGLDVTVETVEGGSHFFPMLRPEPVRAALSEAMDAARAVPAPGRQDAAAGSRAS